MHKKPTTSMSIEIIHKKTPENERKILTRMFLHKFFCQFSSLLSIYKSPALQYNNICRWATVRRVPPMHTASAL